MVSVGINRVHTGGGPLRGGAEEAPGGGRQSTVPIPLRPHHLEAQDADLSRRSRRFESDWGYDSRSRSERRTWACLPGGIGRRGALKRHCPSGREGSSPSGGTGLQWCAENGKQASSGERSPAVIHGACWGTVTEKPLAGSNPVTAEGSRACGAVGSAPPWHGGGQGFDPPQVHHREQESPPHEVVRAVVMQSAGTPSASALGHGMEVRSVHGSSERMERGEAPLSPLRDMAQVGSAHARGA